MTSPRTRSVLTRHARARDACATSSATRRATVAGVSAIQRQGERGRGIGRTPPKDEFERWPLAEGETAPEDDHVRFSHDSATLPEGFLDQFRLLLGRHSGPVTVELHGYSSDDGDQTYNVNLSAQFAVAVKRAVEATLPVGSVVRVIAHGVTAGFGESAEPNRRVGIDLSDRYTISEVYGRAPAAVAARCSGADDRLAAARAALRQRRRTKRLRIDRRRTSRRLDRGPGSGSTVRRRGRGSGRGRSPAAGRARRCSGRGRRRCSARTGRAPRCSAASTGRGCTPRRTAAASGWGVPRAI